MKDEIKEILKYIDQFVYVDQTYNDIKLSKIDVKLILDYITNLQEENEKIKRTCKLYYAELGDYEQKIDKAIEILKLCNSKCSKETINILQGKSDE